MKNRDENFCLGTSSFGEGLGISLPRLRSIGETMAEVDKARKAMIENRMHRLAVESMFKGTIGMPSYPSSRLLEEKKKDVFDGMAAIDRSLAFNERLGLMTDCEIREYMMRPRGVFGAASQPFARAPNHNNELLLLL